MPRPVTNKRAPTMVATSRTSLADALDMNRPNLQEAAREQQATTCTAAATPSHDTESEGGLSEDESHSVLRRDILHNRQEAFRSVVAPVSCATAADNNTAAAVSDDDDEESIPTRPTSVVDHAVPSVPSAADHVSAAPESSESTSAKHHGGYTEDDWDRPMVSGQQQRNWDDVAQAEEYQNDFYQNQEGSFQPAFEEERQDTEPYMARNSSGDSQQYLQYLNQYGDDESRRFAEESALEQPQPHDRHQHVHRHHNNRNSHHHHEIKYAEEEEIYNPDCSCDECIEMFMNQQRRDINRRWGSLFPGLYAEHAPRASAHHTHANNFSSNQPHSQKRVMPSPRSLQRTQEQEATKKQLYDAEGKPMHPRGSRGGNPFALVACCYFKQRGYCKMGNDCWYSHDADESTPCHYGALCKATGHKELVKSTSAPNDSSSFPALAPVPQPVSQQPRMPGQAAPFVAHPTMPAMSSVVPRARPTLPANRSVAAPRPAALLVPSVAPCAYCGAAPQNVMTQEFPVYQGATRTVGQRAHCTQCLRTYSL